MPIEFIHSIPALTIFKIKYWNRVCPEHPTPDKKTHAYIITLFQRVQLYSYTLQCKGRTIESKSYRVVYISMQNQENWILLILLSFPTHLQSSKLKRVVKEHATQIDILHSISSLTPLVLTPFFVVETNGWACMMIQIQELVHAGKYLHPLRLPWDFNVNSMDGRHTSWETTLHHYDEAIWFRWKNNVHPSR
jgi:hypothetical protein